MTEIVLNLLYFLPMQESILVCLGKGFKRLKNIEQVFADKFLQLTWNVLRLLSSVSYLHDSFNHGKRYVKWLDVIECFMFDVFDQSQAKFLLVFETCIRSGEKNQTEVQVDKVHLFGRMLFDKCHSFFDKLHTMIINILLFIIFDKMRSQLNQNWNQLGIMSWT